VRRAANPHAIGSDEYYLYEALQVAHAGLGWTAPNPMVGAVLVRDGAIIGRGAHLHDGQEHAEVLALHSAGEARGATAYVNLEPCTHVGRQQACCQALAAAGITRVVYGAQDGDPRTAGQADAVLAGLGLQCTGGVLQRECAELLDYYLYGHCLQRAFMHLKLALSLDAKLACANGNSQWLSGPESLGYAHYLRQKYDAVLVGYRTVLADDPRLSVRSETLSAYRELDPSTQPRCPVRVVLDPRFELMPQLQTYRLSRLDGNWREHLPQIVIAGAAKHRPARIPEIPGLAILALEETAPGGISFGNLAMELWGLGIRSLLVEGGAGIARSMLQQQVVDKMSLVYTPKLIGNDGMGFAPDLATKAVDKCPYLNLAQALALGQDCLLTGYPVWSGSHGAGETPC
jgi:diaminohydroxyphosphoribosylaminopyrimidine deaminase / 5-amino-6-(5-phosphoribosylamino)uracil reductase